jgi:hypothetical protein
MPATSETSIAERQILIVGSYGVLGTGVVDAVAENRRWGITTAGCRRAPTYRAQAAPPHFDADDYTNYPVLRTAVGVGYFS